LNEVQRTKAAEVMRRSALLQTFPAYNVKSKNFRAASQTFAIALTSLKTEKKKGQQRK